MRKQSKKKCYANKSGSINSSNIAADRNWTDSGGRQQLLLRVLHLRVQKLSASQAAQQQPLGCCRAQGALMLNDSRNGSRSGAPSTAP